MHKMLTLNYDTDNHTDFFAHWNVNNTEIALKNIYKENHIDNLTETCSFVVQGHWNHTEKF